MHSRATLALYLGATFLGSAAYRRWAARLTPDVMPVLRVVVVGIAISALLPIVLADPRFPLPTARVWGPIRVFVAVVPFCALVGFLSPLLVDQWSAGDPRRAGNAYAINTLGCIAGPLLASFMLLPSISERWTILAFLSPLVLLGLMNVGRSRRVSAARVTGSLAIVGVLVAVVMVARDPSERFSEGELRRDYSATVVAATVDGQKHLFVNGHSMGGT